MTNNFLLPHRYKTIGWCLLVPATIAGLVLLLSDFEHLSFITRVFAIFSQEPMEKPVSFSVVSTNITPTVTSVFFLVGALLVSFSKEKIEDEFIAGLRLSSLLWAVLINYVLLLLCTVFIYGVAFFNVMLYNMFTTLIIFIIRFNYILYRNAKEMPNEKYNQSTASY